LSEHLKKACKGLQAIVLPERETVKDDHQQGTSLINLYFVYLGIIKNENHENNNHHPG